MEKAKTDRLIYIDLLRGLSAIAVLLGHVRALANLPWGEVGGGFAARIWVAVSCHGSTAVMIFFVLSGYMVGGGVLRALHSGAWSWRDYAISRFTRLYVVLIPALLLTWWLDAAGQKLLPSSAVYAGQAQNGLHLLADPAAGHSLVVFLGNLLFLQDLVCPVFGTNGPLWSLSYEFWYYLLFPCVLLIFHARRWWEKVAYVLLAGGMAWLLGSKGLFLMIGWLAGAGMSWLVAKLPARPISDRVRLLVWIVFTAGILTIGFTKGMGPAWKPLLPALLTCAILWVETRPSGRPVSWLAKPAVGLSEISYTLYATHLPLVVLVHALWMGNERLPLNFTGISTALVLAVVGCIFAYGWWWLFERRTNAVRDFFRLHLPGGRG